MLGFALNLLATSVVLCISSLFLSIFLVIIKVLIEGFEIFKKW